MTPPPPSVSLDNETTSRMGGGGEDASSQFASAGPRSKLKSRQLHPKPIFDESLVYERTDELGISRMHVKKLWRTIIHHGLVNEDIHTRLPALLFPHSPRKLLGLLQSGEFAILTSRLVKRSDARDGSTTKLLIELQDGQRVESVIMRYGAVELDSFPMEEKKRNNNVEEEVVAKDEIEGEVRVQHDEGFDSTNTTPFSDTASIRSTTTTATTSTRSQRKRDRPKLQGPFRCHRRATVCVSSQVGCAMACTFCATGTMGLLGNLTSGEILEQLFHANSIEQIRGVVFMGKWRRGKDRDGVAFPSYFLPPPLLSSSRYG